MVTISISTKKRKFYLKDIKIKTLDYMFAEIGTK